MIRGEAAAEAAIALRHQGFLPDVICAHPGWGEALFLKDVFPEAAMLGFLEFYYRSDGADFAFDPEFQGDEITGRCRMRLSSGRKTSSGSATKSLPMT